jgi:hypothetical protein
MVSPPVSQRKQPSTTLCLSVKMARDREDFCLGISGYKKCLWRYLASLYFSCARQTKILSLSHLYDCLLPSQPLRHSIAQWRRTSYYFQFRMPTQTEYFVLNTSFTRHSKTGQCHFNSSWKEASPSLRWVLTVLMSVYFWSKGKEYIYILTKDRP